MNKNNKDKPVILSGKMTNHVNSSPQVLSDETGGNPSKFNIYEDLIEEVECPIGFETMKDPVIVPTGQTYERSVIAEWINENGTDPITQKKLTINDLRPNIALKKVIDKLDSYAEQQNIQDDRETQQTLIRSESFFKPEEKNKIFSRAVFKFFTALLSEMAINGDIDNPQVAASDICRQTISCISENSSGNLQDYLENNDVSSVIAKFVDQYHVNHPELTCSSINSNYIDKVLKLLTDNKIDKIKIEADLIDGNSKKGKGSFAWFGFNK